MFEIAALTIGNRLRGSDAPLSTIGKMLTIGALCFAFFHTSPARPGWPPFVAIAAIYLLFEAPGWGKWVGSIVDRKPQFKYDLGPDLMWIHRIADWTCDEHDHYLVYSWIALSIRGLLWWTPMLALFYWSGCMTSQSLLIALHVVYFGFPLAFEIGRFKWIPDVPGATGAWEKGELIYGLLIGIVFGGLI